MTWLKVNSLERYLSYKLWTLALPPLLLWLGFSSYINLSLWVIVLGFTLLVLLAVTIISAINHKMLSSFNRAILHLEAVNQEDYNQYGKSPFTHGCVAEFHQQLKQLSERLQQQKSRYDQHAFLVYQLITQLDTPILVFNEKQQLSFGNEAFYHLYGQHWQMLRHASPELLCLELCTHETDQKWQFTSAQKKQKWQIRQSEFIDGGQRHQLLIFIDIETALRANQLNAWQQIIRVLGHEIGNSLAPVSSMAESLASKAVNERDKMALNVITERCQHLQDFVSRYASLSQPLNINVQCLDASQLLSATSRLYKNMEFKLNCQVKHIWADETLLKQVFINLFKNAQEAHARCIQVNLTDDKHHSHLEIIDNGHGFSNLDNLFVPLYSTKPQGQGIGLNFCRNIIEQHHGMISLENNHNNNHSNKHPQQGVNIKISLPKLSD